MSKRLYVAYGSNLNIRQMKYRCPTAKLYGTGVIEDYELQFKGHPASAYARGIDKSVLDTFIKEKMIYESEDYHNVIFVGFDKNGTPRHAHKRGASIKSTYRGNIDSSMPEYSFHWHGTGGELYVFEAPIDMLSFISLNKDGWEQHSYAAACGVSSIILYQMIKDNPNIHKVWLCHDNDEGGEKAVSRIAKELQEKDIAFERLSPVLKDWNEDLTHPEEVEELRWNQETAIHMC